MDKKITGSIRLDLFKLHNKQDNTKNWILAKGKNLKLKLAELIANVPFSKTGLAKHFMKEFDVSYSTASRFVYLKKEWQPLVFIQEISELSKVSKYEVQDSIDFLKSCKPPVVEYKAVKALSVNLCKIVGAHAADGSLHDSYICITDGYPDNIIALEGWFNEFAFYPKIVKISENEWGLKFHSRIISRYFTKVFDFPSGCKQYTVAEPDIIKNSNIEFRKGFALGALTFEAGIGINRQVALCVASKSFRDSLVDIIQKTGLSVATKDKSGSGYWRFWTPSLSEGEIKQWTEFFEVNTEKWYKLRDMLHGYTGNVLSFQEAADILKVVYPKKSSSKVVLLDVLLAIKELKRTHRYELASYLRRKNNLQSYGGIWAHSLRHYLDILKESNVISVSKGTFGKKKSFGFIIREVYSYNENVKEWKLPQRPVIPLPTLSKTA